MDALSTPDSTTFEPSTQKRGSNLEQRTYLLEKDMQWVKEALTHLLRAQYGKATPLSHPTVTVQVQSAEGFVTPIDKQRSDGNLPLPVTVTP